MSVFCNLLCFCFIFQIAEMDPPQMQTPKPSVPVAPDIVGAKWQLEVLFLRFSICYNFIFMLLFYVHFLVILLKAFSTYYFFRALRKTCLLMIKALSHQHKVVVLCVRSQLACASRIWSQPKFLDTLLFFCSDIHPRLFKLMHMCYWCLLVAFFLIFSSGYQQLQ